MKYKKTLDYYVKVLETILKESKKLESNQSLNIYDTSSIKGLEIQTKNGGCEILLQAVGYKALLGKVKATVEMYHRFFRTV